MSEHRAVSMTQQNKIDALELELNQKQSAINALIVQNTSLTEEIENLTQILGRASDAILYAVETLAAGAGQPHKEKDANTLTVISKLLYALRTKDGGHAKDMVDIPF